ncbi:MAG TPA: SdrD B-like domain-containing protein, partial [Gemmatales bacterium]|nr:SdrD B-like domain-containing protein [Gemmatales bacterium]
MFWPLSQLVRSKKVKNRVKAPPARKPARRPRLSFDFLEERDLPATLTGLVWVDLNNDGFKQSSEPGLSGITITLTGTDTNGAVNQTAITGADGTYSFASLLPGTYSLTQTQPTGFRTGIDSLGTLGGTVGANEFTDIVINAVGDIGANYNFGERGILFTGRVFNDLNGNGVFDGADTGRPGVIVTLTNTLTGFNLPILTDANGDFSFDNLAPGDYTVSATNPTPASFGFTTA